MAYRPRGVYRRNGRKDLAKTDGNVSCRGSIAFVDRSFSDESTAREGISGRAFPPIVAKNTQNEDSKHSPKRVPFYTECFCNRRVNCDDQHVFPTGGTSQTVSFDVSTFLAA